MSTAITPLLVAVIGAGAAGLVTARELRREGHEVVVFERGNQIGGTWVYNPDVESDPLGLDPNRNVIHSSLYASLRTNLPRECMGFRDYPFRKRDEKGRDSRRFPSHREVLMYLQDFAADFGIGELVRLETEVVLVELGEGGKWRVKSRPLKSKNECVDEIYDAVVICNGHHVQPRNAHIPGINAWRGKQMHSHNYRTPKPFQDQDRKLLGKGINTVIGSESSSSMTDSQTNYRYVVVIIGGAASAADISREIATVAKEVHIADRSIKEDKLGKVPGHDNIWLHSKIESVHGSTVVFQDGKALSADFIVHCTGYKYDFPFLETKGAVTVDDNRVGPLYQHVFPPELAPWLSFVGLPWMVAPFPVFERQSKWIAGTLSNRIALPSKQKMTEDIQAFYSSLEASGTPKRYTHKMSDLQWDYDNWISDQCGLPAIEEWRVQMYNATSKNRVLRPESYRDEWDDADLALQAQQDFAQYLIH